MFEKPNALWLLVALTGCAGQPSSERSTRIAAPEPEPDPESAATVPPAVTENTDSEPSGTDCSGEYNAAIEKCEEISLGCDDSEPTCDPRLLLDAHASCFTIAKHDLVLCRCVLGDAGSREECDDPRDAKPTE